MKRIVGKSRHRVSDVTAGWVGEIRSCSCVDGGTSSWGLKEKRLLRVPAEAPLCPDLSELLLRSDRHTGERRRSGGPGRGTVPLQEELNGERTAELWLALDLSGFAGRRVRRGERGAGPRRSAPVLHFHFAGQLREELQDSFEVTTHHLHSDLTGVQFPVVPLTVKWIWDQWNLKTQQRWV